MAGKSKQPSHEPPRGRRKTGTRHTDKTVEKREGKGRGDSLQRSPHTQKTLTKTPTKLLQRPMDHENEESWRMRISNKPLTAKVKLVLLVVNSVKLHLTALTCCIKNFKFSEPCSGPYSRIRTAKLVNHSARAISNI